MRARLAGIVATAALAASGALGGESAHARISGQAVAAGEVRAGSVYARVTPSTVTLGNAVAERRWSRAGLETTALVDKRGGGRTWGARHRDFTLWIAGAPVGSERFRVTGVRTARLARGGLRVTMTLAGPPGLAATRVAEAYPGIAGFRTQTILRPATPLALSAATLDEAAVGRAAPTIHAFRAGADWRSEPGWKPQVAVGDAHTGTWRETRTAGTGAALEAPGEWLSMTDGDRSLFMVAETNDFPSSRAAYDGATASLKVDWSRDVLSLGPFEEQAHVENPGAPAGRMRTLPAGEPFALEPAFTGFGRGDGDEPWQFHRYLVGHRLAPYPHAVVFNSNGTDANRISTGAKDDMDYATVQQVAPIARRLGVETFVLDDGWQAISGDWVPDSPGHTDPRGAYPPRFPDATFDAVRAAIAPMRLGLWMSPLNFNPASETWRAHPDWGCTPAGQATALDNLADPDGGSNEAGIGVWGPAALPWVESRIREAIEQWGVRYFKFDFIAWLDCAGQGDLWSYHDAFLAMLDRLRADFPAVTFQIDETNDYRLFPFESVSRGPTWFQNGQPGPSLLLHNIWDLSPWVPAFALGQPVLGGSNLKDQPLDTLIAAALLSHITFSDDIRTLPPDVVDAAARWIAFYKAHRHDFAGVVYPLLDDPERDGWTALQSWDPDAGRGALLAFRQDADAPSVRIALRDVPPGRSFTLVRAPDGAQVGTATSAQLRQGLTITLPEKRQSEVLLIR